MIDPIILSTWSFGQKANAAGWPHLTGPNTASLEAVEQACRSIEADTDVLSVGRGGCPDRSGEVSLDASIMLSPSRWGAVCYVRRVMHAISIARLVMEKLSQGMLAGEGAEHFATLQGMTPNDLLTDRSRAMWQKWITDHPGAHLLDERANSQVVNLDSHSALPAGEKKNPPHNEFHDTVGVLAMDSQGCLAGACSSSGLPFKIPGRVGDSAIIGHGLYVDPRHGAAVTTGTGELVMGVCGTLLAVELMARGDSPADAARGVLQRIADSFPLREEHQAAIIVLSPSGQWSSASLRPGYHTAMRTSSGEELVKPPCILFP